ncbi:MAG: tripartite tricarboxylate transporter TctB family protein [Betaproteobacteria bacterium]|nr:tripartite tricarboxylate transporter TctB family protein [Betaproteobacteria bacterium]
MKPELRNSKDFLAGLLFLAIGAGAMVVARDYPFGTSIRMGSGYFPTVLGGILVLFGAFLMARGALSRQQATVTWGWKPLAYIVASMLVFGFLLPRLGLVPALAALFFAAAAGGREFFFKEVLALTAVMTAFTVGVFVYVLKLPFQLFPGLYFV